MSEVAATRTRSRHRRIGLSLIALAVLLIPDRGFSIVSETPWEVLILRMVALLVVAVVGVLPWAGTADTGVQRRLRRWAIPGIVASVAYLFSTDPFLLLIGFCLLTGAVLDTWTARATIASETLRSKLTSNGRPTQP